MRQREQGADAFVRQLCWRDFYYQVTRVFPKLSTEALRPAADNDWRYYEAGLQIDQHLQPIEVILDPSLLITLLEVAVDNAPAQRLYASYDFEPVGIRRGYYQPSNTDALVMMRNV